jgi:DNA-binding NarL/FixJ family response regulator
MSHAKTLKVMLVDDHPLFCRGLVSLIAAKPGYTVIGEAATLSDALKIAARDKPSLAIVEINLSNESGLELIPRLKAQNPDIAILVLSMHDERYYSERILRLGARGYIMKTEPASTVLDAIQTVMSGKVFLSETERERIFQAMTGESRKGVKDWAMRIRKLSDRELQVFSCIGKGMRTVDIAAKYELSAKTIDTHKEHIKLKLHCNSSHELRQFAIEWSTYPGTAPEKAHY